jgi:hypothetical protein
VNGAHLHMMEGNRPDARGNSIVQKDSAELFVWYLASLISECIKWQILPLLIVPNFGSDVNIPDVVLEAVNPKAILEDLAIDKMLQDLGLPLDPDDIYDRAGRAPPSDLTKAILPPSRMQPQTPNPLQANGNGLGNTNPNPNPNPATKPNQPHNGDKTE